MSETLTEQERPREAVLGELIHDSGSDPNVGWFMLGVEGYFDIDNAVWCHPQDGDAPWDSDHFELHGTIPDLASRLADVSARLAAVEAAISDRVTPTLRTAHWAVDPLPSCPQYAHVNPDWLLAAITEARDVRAALRPDPSETP